MDQKLSKYNRYPGYIGTIVKNPPHQRSFEGPPTTVDQWYELPRSEITHMMDHLVGIPVKVEHGEVTVGVVDHVFFSKKGDLRVALSFYDDPAGDGVRQTVHTQENLGLSLKHDADTLIPIEVSICQTPARPGCYIDYIPTRPTSVTCDQSSASIADLLRNCNRLCIPGDNEDSQPLEAEEEAVTDGIWSPQKVEEVDVDVYKSDTYKLPGSQYPHTMGDNNNGDAGRGMVSASGVTRISVDEANANFANTGSLLPGTVSDEFMQQIENSNGAAQQARAMQAGMGAPESSSSSSSGSASGSAATEENKQKKRKQPVAEAEQDVDMEAEPEAEEEDEGDGSSNAKTSGKSPKDAAAVLKNFLENRRLRRSDASEVLKLLEHQARENTTLKKRLEFSDEQRQRKDALEYERIRRMVEGFTSEKMIPKDEFMEMRQDPSSPAWPHYNHLIAAAAKAVTKAKPKASAASASSAKTSGKSTGKTAAKAKAKPKPKAKPKGGVVAASHRFKQQTQVVSESDEDDDEDYIAGTSEDEDDSAVSSPADEADAGEVAEEDEPEPEPEQTQGHPHKKQKKHKKEHGFNKSQAQQQLRETGNARAQKPSTLGQNPPKPRMSQQPQSSSSAPSTTITPSIVSASFSVDQVHDFLKTSHSLLRGKNDEIFVPGPEMPASHRFDMFSGTPYFADPEKAMRPDRIVPGKIVNQCAPSVSGFQSGPFVAASARGVKPVSTPTNSREYNPTANWPLKPHSISDNMGWMFHQIAGAPVF